MDTTDTHTHTPAPPGVHTEADPWNRPHTRGTAHPHGLARDRELLLEIAADLIELPLAEAPTRLAPLLERALPRTQLHGWEWLALEEDTRTYRCAQPPVVWPELLGWTITQLWLDHALVASPREPLRHPNGHLIYVSIPAGAQLRGGLGCLISSTDPAGALTALVAISRLLRIPTNSTSHTHHATKAPDEAPDEALDEASDPAATQRPLSARQERILALMTRGLTNRQIATRIGYSESTVRMETMAIYRALHVQNRHQAAHLALNRPPPANTDDTTSAAGQDHEHTTTKPTGYGAETSGSARSSTASICGAASNAY